MGNQERKYKHSYVIFIDFLKIIMSIFHLENWW